MHSFGFRTRIALLLGASLLALMAMAANSFFKERHLIEQSKRDTLVTVVQAAHATVQAFQAKAARGEMGLAEAQQAAKQALRGSRYGGPDGKADYLYIWNVDGIGVMHPLKPEWEGQNMLGRVKDGAGADVIETMTSAMRASQNGKAFALTHFPRPGQTEPQPKLQYLLKVPEWNWMVGSGLYMDDVETAVRNLLWTHLLFVGAVLALVGVLGAVVMRSVTRQLGGEPEQAIAIMTEVAKGHLDTPIPPAPAGSLLHGLETMVAALRNLVTEVRRASDSIATASSEIAQGNTDLSHRTENTASNLQKTASAMEQLTSTVQHTNGSADTANQLAASAAQVARRGGEVVADVVATMQEINASSSKIADIIGVIDGIAFQTNILALNAAVEAARAGEQGRGFAVVAAEVRSLAQRSAEAAKEIKLLIHTSVDKVEAGTRLVGDAGATMQEIVASVQRVSSMIEEIRTATAEQSDGIGDVNTAVNQLDQMTQQNSALVEESAAAADSLREQAMKLTELISTFRIAGMPSATPAAAPRPAVRTAAPLRPATRPPAATAPARLATAAHPSKIAPTPAGARPAATDDWESF